MKGAPKSEDPQDWEGWACLFCDTCKALCPVIPVAEPTRPVEASIAVGLADFALTHNGHKLSKGILTDAKKGKAS